MRIQFDPIDAEGELDAAATCKAYLQVSQEAGRHDGTALYLVRETKGTRDFRKLRTAEADMVRCVPR